MVSPCVSETRPERVTVGKYMRTLCCSSLGALSAFPQFSVGFKAGVPLTDFFSTVNSPRFGFNSEHEAVYHRGRRCSWGCRRGLAIEFDALYRRLNYEGSGSLSLVDVFTNNRTTGNAWEFPLLLKYHFPTVAIKPYVAGGVAWDTVSGVKQSFTNTIRGITSSGSTDNPDEFNKKNTIGVVVGAGVDIKAIFLHVLPEVRYTRWGSEHFSDAAGLIKSNRNQAEFLLGIRF